MVVGGGGHSSPHSHTHKRTAEIVEVECCDEVFFSFIRRTIASSIRDIIAPL